MIYGVIWFDIFRGSGPGGNSRDISDRLMTLKNDLADLRQRELELDKHKMWVQQSIKNVTDEVTNTRYEYGSFHLDDIVFILLYVTYIGLLYYLKKKIIITLVLVSSISYECSKLMLFNYITALINLQKISQKRETILNLLSSE